LETKGNRLGVDFFRLDGTILRIEISRMSKKVFERWNWEYDLPKTNRFRHDMPLPSMTTLAICIV
jgi:hypothetical protein